MVSSKALWHCCRKLAEGNGASSSETSPSTPRRPPGAPALEPLSARLYAREPLLGTQAEVRETFSPAGPPGFSVVAAQWLYLGHSSRVPALGALCDPKDSKPWVWC